MNPLLATYVSEARDLLEIASSGLLLEERGGGGAENLNEVFRAVHTLKGGAGLVGLSPLAMLLHAGEDLLDAMRSDRLDASESVVDALLESLDVASRWLDSVTDTDALPDDADALGSELAMRLRLRLEGRLSKRGAAAMDARFEDLPPLLRSQIGRVPDEGLLVARVTPRPRCFFDGVDPLALVLGIPELVGLMVVEPASGWGSLEELDAQHCHFEVLAASTAHRQTIEFSLLDVLDDVAFERVPPPRESKVERSDSPVAPKTKPTAVLKVSPDKVDAVLNLVGELTVAKNGLSHLARKAEDQTVARELLEQHAYIERITLSLQNAVMQMRLMPVGIVFQRIPRLVRDLARDLGKQVELVVEGEDTEADRTVIEALGEPILHIVRNSLDHGIEGPDARAASGKSALAVLRLAATQDGDRLVLSVSDDGRGIDPARIARKAIERGLVDEATLSTMTPDAIVALIFEPGFSTAEKISDVSGRGVGMDAVRHAVEAFGGHVTLVNEPGKGMTTNLHVPITMAFSRVLVVRIGRERFGVPFDAVEGVLKLRERDLGTVGGLKVLLWRGGVVPVIPLRDRLGVSAGRVAGVRSADPSSFDDLLAILVVKVGGELLALAGEAFEADLDVVVKPLSGPLVGTPGIAGTAILGDGSVLLVLEPKEVAEWLLDSKMVA